MSSMLNVASTPPTRGDTEAPEDLGGDSRVPGFATSANAKGFKHESPFKLIRSNFLIGELSIRIVILTVWLTLRHTAPVMQVFTLQDQWLEYAYPYSLSPQIPGTLLIALSVGIPAAVGVICISLLAISLRRHASLRFLFKELCFFALASSLSLLLAGAVTNIIKIFVGRPRPDYLARCFPSQFSAAQVPALDLANLIHESVPLCEPEGLGLIDGRKSFPSGHSSYLAAVSVCSALYIHHVLRLVRAQTVLWRRSNTKTGGTFIKRLSLFQLLTSPGLDACLCGSLAVLLPAWAGATRVVDRRHHASDVFAGLIIGAIFGALSFRLYFRPPHPLLDALYPQAPSTLVLHEGSPNDYQLSEATSPLTFSKAQ
eukprot:Protomagalhaensia_wolfi_Nauph_80__6081@NODE_858_length_1943_cov_21_753151_g646_i0_p1_GENE_NODE_858_length_1943_cov_21_753151_g646_i0NODE_858_length_1943_cov_21_753151_g646_i0_p1_ORF_typecomplete_len371_score46_14PAP2/PF01569_21/2_9e03PAP2/PF01569_21/2_9e27_NODE_858_length_1943_cov_21_753151_g646_i0281140